MPPSVPGLATPELLVQPVPEPEPKLRGLSTDREVARWADVGPEARPGAQDLIGYGVDEARSGTVSGSARS